MKPPTLHVCLLPFILAFTLVSQANEIPQARLDESQRAFLRESCVACHDADKQKGKVRLDDIAFTIDSIPSADLWQKVLDAVNSGEMPPEEETQPETGAKTEFLDALSGTLVVARKVLADQGGKITMRRLNRREYRNSLRDLLGVQVDVRDLPEDGGTGSFDTVGASLFMSGDQIEQYLAIGRRALDQHYARAAAPASKLPVRTEAEVFGNKRMDNLYQSTQEQHERFVKWTAAVDEAAKRPGNVEVAARLREEAKKPRPSSGVHYATPLFFYLDWDQIAGAPHPKDFGFPDAQKAFFDKIQYDQHFDYYRAYQSLPGRDAGAWLLFYQAYRETYVETPADWPVGDYTLRMRVAANPDVVAERRFVEIGQRGEDNSAFTVLSAHQVTGTLENPQIIEVNVPLSPGGKREFALRERRPNSQAAEIRSYYDEKEKTGRAPLPAIWVDWFEIEGPQPVPTGPAILTVPGPDKNTAREAIRSFATRAFRGRIPDDDYLDRLADLHAVRLAAGSSPEESMKETLAVVLASPGFLYLHEPASADGPRTLDALELATRLSYFLWSAPPDEELLALAASGKLGDPAILAAQTDRLLADPRSHEFASGFTHQWLGLDRLDFFQFDFKLHRAFDDSAKADSREEVYETFATLLRENASLTKLLKSNFVVVNGLLANYYGLDGVTGDHFRKVTLPPGSPRGGLLGMAAILAMGGNGAHTSPVERGAWVLRKLLHDPPPPAPPNVPQLARLDGKPLDVRARLLAHQEEAQCASCHRKIDPIGFGLENFGAAGKWRTEDHHLAGGKITATWPVDPSGAFHKGPSFRDYFELRDLVAAQDERFARGFTEALVEYALGRPFGFSDEELASTILGKAQEKELALPSFIHALVASEAFRRK
jgi:hypothetical protein